VAQVGEAVTQMDQTTQQNAAWWRSAAAASALTTRRRSWCVPWRCSAWPVTGRQRQCLPVRQQAGADALAPCGCKPRRASPACFGGLKQVVCTAPASKPVAGLAAPAPTPAPARAVRKTIETF
jgi:hypothetical protein